MSTLTDEQLQGLLSVNGALARLANLDLTLVKAKLCASQEDEGKGWTPKHANAAEEEYRRFLVLNLLSDGEPTVPSHTVDEFWHAHILDTRAYLTDTTRIFGRYLHHNPYFGRGGEKEARELDDAYVRTLNRYRSLFGPPNAEIWRATGPTCTHVPSCSGTPPPGPPPKCSSHPTVAARP
jgi:hypothetical protein